MPEAMHRGPLTGLRVVELESLGPVPFAGMVLSDLGADVVRVERPPGWTFDRPSFPDQVMGRGRRSIAVDLKHGAGKAVAHRLLRRADVLIEGFRPGVAERLGLGPDECLRLNSRLVYARATGWGQDGPLANKAGHDIDFIAIAGVLGQLGDKGAVPPPPLNLVGDFGGGGMLLVTGVLAALYERSASGAGQVVDAAMVDGALLLMAGVFAARAAGQWVEGRQANAVDGGAPFNRSYRTADGKFVAVGAMEHRFFVRVLDVLGLEVVSPEEQWDRRRWPALGAKIAAQFASRTRIEWEDAFRDVDACFASVLELDELVADDHLAYRESVVTLDGVLQPAPAPRFSRTPGSIAGACPAVGEHTVEVLREAEFSTAEIDDLLSRRAVFTRG
jgi:alpha-methylacyl-CoA racemase